MKSMKNFLQILFFTVVFINPSISNCQIGITAGLNVSTLDSQQSVFVTQTQELFIGSNFMEGLHIGLTYEVPINKKLSFETGLIYLRKAYPYILDVEMGEDIIFFERFAFFELPLLLKTYLPVAELKLMLSGGPTISYGSLDSHVVVFNRGQGNSFTNKQELRLFDWGLQMNAGIVDNRVQINMYFNISLNELNVEGIVPNKKQLYNKVVGISAQYVFRKKNKF